MKSTPQNKSVSKPNSYFSAFANRLKPKYANPEVFNDFSNKLLGLNRVFDHFNVEQDPLRTEVAICMGITTLTPVRVTEIDPSNPLYQRFESDGIVYICFLRLHWDFNFNIIWLTTGARPQPTNAVVICGYSDGASMALKCGQLLSKTQPAFFTSKCSVFAIAPSKCLTDQSFSNLSNVNVYISGTEYNQYMYVDHSYFEGSSAEFNYSPVNVLNLDKEIVKILIMQTPADYLVNNFYESGMKIKIDKEKNVFHSKDAYLRLFRAEAFYKRRAEERRAEAEAEERRAEERRAEERTAEEIRSWRSGGRNSNRRTLKK